MTDIPLASLDDQPAMRVDVWADIVCPWCRLGKAYLERAIQDFAHADDVVVLWHSFELDPNAPAVRTESLSEHLSQKLGRTPEQVGEIHEQIQSRGAAVDVGFDFENARSGNTFDAHRLLHLAAARGRQDELATALYEAYHAGGEPIGDVEALQRIAVAAGLDSDEARGVLASDAFADDVRADERAAQQMGISGVPFFVFDGRIAASGAQPPEVLLAGLNQAWTSRTTPSE